MSLIMPGTGFNAGVGFDPFFPIVTPGNGIGGFVDPLLCAVFGINCPTPVPGIPPPIEEPGGGGFPPGIPRFPQFPSEGGNLICDLFGIGCPPEAPGLPAGPMPNGGNGMPQMPFNGCVTPTATAAPRAPSVNMFACPNTRGGFDFWGKLGRPLWFSRDNQVVRRGKKLARRLR